MKELKMGIRIKGLFFYKFIYLLFLKYHDCTFEKINYTCTL